MTLPMMSALTFTCVLGSILPGARTRDVMSSARTRASCTGTPFFLPPWAAMLAMIRMIIRAPPRPIQSHLFFIRRSCLLRGLLRPSPDTVDLGLGHPNGRQRADRIARGSLELNLGVDQLQDRRRADIVLLLSELHVLHRRIEPLAGDAVPLDRREVGQKCLIHLGRQVATGRIVRLYRPHVTRTRVGDPGLGPESGEQVPVQADGGRVLEIALASARNLFRLRQGHTIAL